MADNKMYLLRNFKRSDLSSVVRIHLSAFKDIGETRATFEKFLYNPKVITLVVKNKNTHRIVGYYSVKRATKSKWFLCWTSIAKTYRGQGLGELMIQDCLKRARKEKVKEVSLSSRNRFRPAMICYLNCGFQVTGTHKGKDGDTMIEFRWTP